MPEELAKRVGRVMHDINAGIFHQDEIGNCIRDLIYIIRNRQPPELESKEKKKKPVNKPSAKKKRK